MLVHSNLDDGYGAKFGDRAITYGWAMLEKYIVEKLIGAEITHCFGNVVSDPQERLAFLFALADLHGDAHVGSLLVGNTIGYKEDLDRSVAVLAITTHYDIIGQLKRPTGHAILPTPITEALRVPSAEEIVAAHVLAREVEQESRGVVDLIDWAKIDQLKDQIVEGGQRFYETILKGLNELGVDTEDPVEMIFILKQLGAENIERYFGVGVDDEALPTGRRPLVPTSMFKRLLKYEEEIRTHIKKTSNQKIQRLKVIVASTDVHAYGVYLIKVALQSLGVKEIVDLGTNVDYQSAVDAALKANGDVLIVGTYNGLALDYAKALLEAMKHGNSTIPVIMGGKLNQSSPEQGLPIDVTDDLINLGIITCKAVNDLPESLEKAVNSIPSTVERQR